jgi:hypothetical protein
MKGKAHLNIQEYFKLIDLFFVFPCILSMPHYSYCK